VSTAAQWVLTYLLVIIIMSNLVCDSINCLSEVEFMLSPVARIPPVKGFSSAPLCIGAMHCLAVVSQSFLREPFRVMVNSHQISARLRPSDYGAQPSQSTCLCF